MNNIMLDLETLGTGNNAVIISIGAVLFDKDGVSKIHSICASIRSHVLMSVWKCQLQPSCGG